MKVNAIEQKLIEVMSKYFEGDLSELPTIDPLVKFPAIVYARDYTTGKKNPALPDYPYATVDIVGVFRDGSEAAQYNKKQWVEDPIEGWFLVYSGYYIVSLEVSFYGGRDSNVEYLANKLQMLCNTNVVLDQLTKIDDLNLELRSTSEIRYQDPIYQDKFLRKASLNLDFATQFDLAFPESDIGYFNSISIDTTSGGFFDTEGKKPHLDIIETINT